MFKLKMCSTLFDTYLRARSQNSNSRKVWVFISRAQENFKCCKELYLLRKRVVLHVCVYICCSTILKTKKSEKIFRKF